MDALGLSMALGTFIAGVLLAESEYRHELEIAIDPFKGLLLGLFFISVGMALNLGVLYTHLLWVVVSVAILVAVKTLVLYLLALILCAGAALGAITDKFPAWNQTFWQHLDVAIKLHNVHTVMVMDHRDCGAYKVVLGEDFGKDPARETAAHTVQLQSLRRMIVDKYPKMKVELLLMGLELADLLAHATAALPVQGERLAFRPLQ